MSAAPRAGGKIALIDHPVADLLVAYDWPYDEPFLGRLEQTMHVAGLALTTASPPCLGEVFRRLECGELQARAFLDRAADTDPTFEPLEAWAADHVPRVLNPREDRRRAWRKSVMHWDFIRAGLHTPHTIHLPAWNRGPVLDPPPDLSPLGEAFAIKPDLGGGGWGVTLGARSWEQVEQARREMPEDELLLQAMVEPERVAGRRAWFRVFYACGDIVPCWWDDRTRLFGEWIDDQARREWRLDGLWETAEIAAAISRLQLFSTEVARLPDGRWIVVDYVNDPVDLRLLPNVREGMPPLAAQHIADAIAAFVGRQG